MMASLLNGLTRTKYKAAYHSPKLKIDKSPANRYPIHYALYYRCKADDNGTLMLIYQSKQIIH